jgi:hypothetical protein
VKRARRVGLRDDQGRGTSPKATGGGKGDDDREQQRTAIEMDNVRGPSGRLEAPDPEAEETNTEGRKCQAECAARHTGPCALGEALSKFMLVVENYPDLKANQNFLALQEELATTENKIGFARQYYNDVAMRYKNRVETFPSNIVANLFGFRSEPFSKWPALRAAWLRLRRLPDSAVHACRRWDIHEGGRRRRGPRGQGRSRHS